MEKELSETKYFDLKFDALCEELFPRINRKNADFPHDCEAPLRVYKKPKGKTLYVSGIDLVDCGDWVDYTLKFKTIEDAKSAYNTLKKHELLSMTTINKMQWCVDSIKILEQAYENMNRTIFRVPHFKKATISNTSETKTAKLPFRQRFKNAWQALKG